MPTNSEIPVYDYSVFTRELTGADYQRKTGPVYQLIWGRHTTPDFARQFADNVQANLLITGHQPQEMGYGVNGDNQIIIASDHNQGICLQINLDITYDIDGLVGCAKKFVAMDV